MAFTRSIIDLTQVMKNKLYRNLDTGVYARYHCKAGSHRASLFT